MVGSPSAHQRQEGWILLLLGVLTLVLVFGRMVRLTDIPNAGPLRVLVVAVLGIGVMVAAVVWLRPWLATMVAESTLYFVVMGATFVVSLVVIVPLMALIQKSSIPSALFSWFTCVFAAASVVLIARTGIDLFSSGSAEAQRTKERSAEIQKFLNDN